MQFGIFYEHQLPRPWVEGAELKLFQDALDQVELADKLGIDYAWEVEHHFLEEYAHSSAPEVFLAACSQRTKRIRLGHGIVLMPPPYNHPARVAERIATLDLVSAGRVEWGTGESASLAELGGFGVSVQDKQPMWHEATREAANMMVMDPYPGYQGKYFSMPCRNVVPKPVQKPHPPIWVAASRRETIHEAARDGIGALTFAFIDPAEAIKWVGEYYDIIKSEACVPIGHSVNANIAMVGGFSCHADAEEARRRGLDGFRFFGYALGHHYIFGEHLPGRTNIWANYERARDLLPIARGGAGAIGSPGRARGEETGGARAVHRSGAQAQAANGAARRSRHPDHRRARPPAGQTGVGRRQDRQLRPRQRDERAARGPAQAGQRRIVIETPQRWGWSRSVENGESSLPLAISLSRQGIPAMPPPLAGV